MAFFTEKKQNVKESSPIVIHTAKEWHIRTVICMLIGSLKAKMDRPNYFLTSSCFLAHEADDGTYWDKQTTRYIMAPPQNIFFFFFFSNYLFPPSKKQKNYETIAGLCHSPMSSLFRLSPKLPRRTSFVSLQALFFNITE